MHVGGGHKDLVVYLIEEIKCDVGECVDPLNTPCCFNDDCRLHY